MAEPSEVLSPATRLRWHLVTAYLLEVVAGQTDWRWPDEVSGSLRRRCEGVRKHVGRIDRAALTGLIASERKRLQGGGEVAAMALIPQLEEVLTFYPESLLKYLHHANTCGLDGACGAALLHVALCRTRETEKVAALENALWSRRPKRALAQPGARVSTESPRFLTSSQRFVFERLHALGELFFAGETGDIFIKPRLNPLVGGPTGVGKTYVVVQVAKALSAHVIRKSFGDWIPVGASSEYSPSQVAIVDAVVAKPRVVLVLDELDRWVDDTASSWSRSCLGDLFQLVDKALSLDAYLRLTKNESARDLGETEIRQLLQRRLWICGIGTWQSVHTTIPIGFGHGSTRDAGELQHAIATSGSIPDELLLRFNPGVILLNYPTPSETAAILDECGLSALAAAVGQPLLASELDWSRGGMRTLEDIATRLLLKRRELRARQDMALPPTHSATAI